AFSPSCTALNTSSWTSVASAANWLLRPPGANRYSSSAVRLVVRTMALDTGSFSIRHGNGAIVPGAGGVGGGAAVFDEGGAPTYTGFDTSQGIAGRPGAVDVRISTRYAPGVAEASKRTPPVANVARAPSRKSPTTPPGGRAARAITVVPSTCR